MNNDPYTTLYRSRRDLAELGTLIDQAEDAVEAARSRVWLAVEGKNEAERKARHTLALADDSLYQAALATMRELGQRKARLLAEVENAQDQIASERWQIRRETNERLRLIGAVIQDGYTAAAQDAAQDEIIDALPARFRELPF